MTEENLCLNARLATLAQLSLQILETVRCETEDSVLGRTDSLHIFHVIENETTFMVSSAASDFQVTCEDVIDEVTLAYSKDSIHA